MSSFKARKKSAILRSVKVLEAKALPVQDGRLDGDGAMTDQMSERDMYEFMKRQMDFRHGERNWKDLAKKLADAKITNRYGAPYSADGARVKFYELKKRFDPKLKLTNVASQLTGKVGKEESKAEAQKILKLIDGVLKLDADPETKLDLLRKIL